jgi:hypothetical protein
MSTTAFKALSGRTRTRFKGELAAPDNSKYTILLDTTQGLPNNVRAVPGKSAALPTPGAILGQALGRVFYGLISCTTNDCTLQVYYLNGAGAWSINSTKTATITAAAADKIFTVDPSLDGAEDVLIVALAGATASDHIYATLIERTVP